MSDSTIGQRAAEELLRIVREEDITMTAAYEEISIPSACFCRWQHGQTAPRAQTLANMHRAGYDVLYILTGERSPT